MLLDSGGRDSELGFPGDPDLNVAAGVVEADADERRLLCLCGSGTAVGARTPSSGVFGGGIAADMSIFRCTACC